MGILDNFEEWVNFDRSTDSMKSQMMKECICENCDCKNVNSPLWPQPPCFRAGIYFLMKTLDDCYINLGYLQAGKELNDNVYDNLWYEEQIEKSLKKIKKIKELLLELIKEL